jgi:hypothetical protein
LLDQRGRSQFDPRATMPPLIDFATNQNHWKINPDQARQAY